MPEPEYTDGDAVDIIENEGIAYAVQHYCDGWYFKNEETAALWTRADKALSELEAHLKRSTGRGF